MKRTVLLVSFIFAAVLCSCERIDEPDYPYYNDIPASQYELNELLEAFKSSIDIWHTNNQYSESLLCGKPWEFLKIYLETYVDGELSETSDYPFPTSSSVFFFNENHSMRLNDSKGTWFYINNHIIMKHDGSYYSYEVAGVTETTLILKEEKAWFVETTQTFDIDKSGKHRFAVREYVAK